MSKHTPGPWAADSCDVEQGLTTICTTYPYAHGIDPYGVENVQIAEANAAHIVRCVNSHDAMKAALENVADISDDTLNSATLNDFGILFRSLRHQARAALLKASPDKSMEQV